MNQRNKSLYFPLNSNDRVTNEKGEEMLKIHAFAKLCGCKVYTLRYYDEVGLLRPCIKDELSHYRYYSVNQLSDYEKIKEFQDIGFSVKELKKMKKDSDEKIVSVIEDKIHSLNQMLIKAKELQKKYK